MSQQQRPHPHTEEPESKQETITPGFLVMGYYDPTATAKISSLSSPQQQQQQQQHGQVESLDAQPWRVDETWRVARNDGYDFVCTPILLPSQQQQQSIVRQDVLTLDSHTWKTSVVGVVVPPPAQSTTVTTTVEGRTVANNSQISSSSSALSDAIAWIQSSLEWAWHMNLPAVLMPPLDATLTVSLEEYAVAVGRIAQQIDAGNNSRSNFQLWIPVSLDSQSWRAWQRFHATIGQYTSTAVGILLTFAPLPTQQQQQAAATAEAAALHLEEQLQLLHAFIGGSTIHAVCIPTQLFAHNKRNFPTLYKTHQTILLTLLQRLGRTIRALVLGPSLLHPSLYHQPQTAGATNGAGTTSAAGLSGYKPYQQYLQHMRSKVATVLDTTVARMEQSYLDSLQAPLQPLRDHLEFETYEIFEKDPVKYKQYQAAIYKALYDFYHVHNSNNGAGSSSSSTTNPNANALCSCCHLMVVGAGRGPLVSCAVSAHRDLVAAASSSSSSSRMLHMNVYAVEKNPSAIPYLQSKLQFDPLWQQQQQQSTALVTIHIVQADLRELTIDQVGGRQADIFVSELLGSFGCNELSPECLDALYYTRSNVSPTKTATSNDVTMTDATNNTNQNETTRTNVPVCGPHTVSIPCQYTSYLAPVSSTTLYQRVRQRATFPYDDHGPIGATRALETPYVVRAHAASQMHPEQPCWDFSHPPPEAAASGSHTNTAMAMDHHMHNRSVVLEFSSDDRQGLSLGSGYGAYDPSLEPTTSTTQANGSLTTTTAAADLPWTLTGFLGTFTALLYSGGNKSSTNDDNNEEEKEDTTSGSAAMNDSTGATNDPADDDVIISTAPCHDFSTGMFSWFPLYFPLPTPIHVPARASLRVHMVRHCSAVAVWYEWTATVHLLGQVVAVTPLANPNGRSCSISKHT